MCERCQAGVLGSPMSRASLSLSPESQESVGEAQHCRRPAPRAGMVDPVQMAYLTPWPPC